MIRWKYCTGVECRDWIESLLPWWRNEVICWKLKGLWVKYVWRKLLCLSRGTWRCRSSWLTCKRLHFLAVSHFHFINKISKSSAWRLGQVMSSWSGEMLGWMGSLINRGWLEYERDRDRRKAGFLVQQDYVHVSERPRIGTLPFISVFW